MKRFKYLLMSSLLLSTTAMVSSCDVDNDENDKNVVTAIVTVRPAVEGTPFYLRLSDTEKLHPVNMTTSPYGDKEVRAYVRYAATQSETIGTGAVQVYWLDSIMTKRTSPDLGELNAKTYGDDPVEIISGSETSAEDGYLTLRFRTLWGRQKAHSVYLTYTMDDNGQPTATFHHNANGDPSSYYGDGVVAFRLDDKFNAGDEPLTITLRWKSFSGDKSATFKYKPRKD